MKDRSLRFSLFKWRYCQNNFNTSILAFIDEINDFKVRSISFAHVFKFSACEYEFEIFLIIFRNENALSD